MEPGQCNVLYIDRNVKEDRRLSTSEEALPLGNAGWETPRIAENVKHLLDVFGQGWSKTAPAYCHGRLTNLALPQCT